MAGSGLHGKLRAMKERGKRSADLEEAMTEAMAALILMAFYGVGDNGVKAGLHACGLMKRRVMAGGHSMDVAAALKYLRIVEPRAALGAMVRRDKRARQAKNSPEGWSSLRRTRARDPYYAKREGQRRQSLTDKHSRCNHKVSWGHRWPPECTALHYTPRIAHSLVSVVRHPPTEVERPASSHHSMHTRRRRNATRVSTRPRRIS